MTKILIDRATAEQALDALKEFGYHGSSPRWERTANALKAALEQQPVQEPTPWRDMVVVSLVREGVNKHKARELADHFATQPLPVQEPVACRFCFSKKGCWAWQCYKCGEIDDVQKPAPPPVQEPPQYSLKAHWTDDKRIGVVACVTRPDGGVHLLQTIIDSPSEQRQPLTDEQIDELSHTMVKGNKSANWLCRAIEAAHGVKGDG